MQTPIIPAGETPEETARVNRLAQEMDISPSKVRASLRNLEARGLIRRCDVAEDIKTQD